MAGMQIREYGVRAADLEAQRAALIEFAAGDVPAVGAV